MFDGVPAEQFHQFLVSRSTNIPFNIPLSFLSEASSPPSYPSFDPSCSLFSSHHQPIFQSHLIQQLQHQSASNSISKDGDDQLPKQQVVYKKASEEEEEEEETIDPWSTNEVLALLRIRSTSVENWFPADFTWEHVSSRKLAELGYKRSAKKCKEKYEEETSCRNINGIGYKQLNNKYLIGELDELIPYPDNTDDQNNYNLSIMTTDDHQQALCDQGDQDGKVIMKEVMLEELEGPKEKEIADPPAAAAAASQEDEQVVDVVKQPKGGKKRKSNEKKFEMFKGFCEEIVSKMIKQQEELHNKLIQDMMKRSEETIAREEAWKRQEMERANKEIDTRAHEQVLGDRQATMIIEFLNKFTPEKSYPFGINYDQEDLISIHPNTLLPPQTPTSIASHGTPTSTLQNEDQNPKMTQENALKLSKMKRKPAILGFPNDRKLEKPTYIFDGTEDIGKRWPRDEVEALINMRCSLYSSNHSNNHEDQKEGISTTSSNKGGSIWEKISQGMLELGYLRSAKRCKEKWENINKYFRKTKDVNKKRAVDSRTCPYFQQLSSLYKREALTAPSEEAVKPATLPENHSSSPEGAI